MSNVETMIKRIEALAASEKVTKAELSALSRELLEYICVEKSDDIGMVNRLMNVLTPMNKRTAGLFFSHFLPFKLESTAGIFGKKIKGDRHIKSKYDNAVSFLENKDNDIWTWAAQNVKVEQKPVDFAKKIAGDVSKALADEDNGLDPVGVIMAVLAGGVKLTDIIDGIEAGHIAAPSTDEADTPKTGDTSGSVNIDMAKAA